MTRIKHDTKNDVQHGSIAGWNINAEAGSFDTIRILRIKCEARLPEH